MISSDAGRVICTRGCSGQQVPGTESDRRDRRTTNPIPELHDSSGVVHDVSDVGHDVGHVIGDVLRGKLSKLPGDVSNTGAGVFKAGADAGKGAANAVNGVGDLFRNGVKPPGTDGSGHGSGSDPNHGGGSNGRTQTDQDPQPTVPTETGGGEDQQSSDPVSSQAPSSAGTPTSPTLHSSAHSTPIPSRPTLSGSPSNDAATARWYSSSLPSFAKSDDLSSASTVEGQPGNGVTIGASSSTSTTLSTTRTGSLTGGGAAHRKGLPLAAVAALGAVLGFLVVSALFWAVWLYLRKRRRAFRAVYLPPKRMLSVTTARTVSTVPLFISASEAGFKDENPFKHPLDVHEDDPFDAASLWRSSTTCSASTLSV